MKQQLLEMEAAVAEWAGNAVDSCPRWRSKHADGEHDQRRRLCEFTDLDGVVRVFDQHLYFTPGAGRLYFRLDPEARTAIIAHVGAELL